MFSPVVEEVLVDLVGEDERSWASAKAAICISSARVKTLPEGLAGVFTRTARVRDVRGRLEVGVRKASRYPPVGRTPGLPSWPPGC